MPFLFAVVAVLAGALTSPTTLTAQSVLSGSLRGTVTDPSGQPITRAVLTLRALGAGASQEAITGSQGSYAFPLVAPGTYEIRAEAFGYQPLVARTLELAGGDAARVPLVLQVATPPVVAIDTVAIAATTTGRIRPGGVRFGGADLDQLPSRFGELGGLVGLSSRFDGTMGGQGLPGTMSLVVADGIPVHRAQHPFLREVHLADGLFPRALTSSVTAFHNAPDTEWAGAAGGYASLSTLSGVAGGAEIEGAWSGAPLWSSGELDLDQTPGLTSFQGAGRAQFDVKPDTTQLLVAAEILRHETPFAPRIGSELTTALEGIDPELLVSLAAPSVERIARYSGLGRFYTQPSETSRVFIRGTVTYSERSFDGPGPIQGHGTGLDEASTEFSIAGSFVSEIRPGLSMDVRAGVSGSDRVFESAVPGLASAYLVERGTTLGAVPGVPADVSRTDVVLVPTMRLDLGTQGTLKGGFSAGLARHDTRSDMHGAGDFLFSDADALLNGVGLARRAELADASFSTNELGAFAQYDVEPLPGLALSLGARIDEERIPAEEPALNQAWLEASGLSNDDYPSSFPQIGARASASWDPGNDGRTRVSIVGSLHSGDLDPRHLFEAFALDGPVESTIHAGGGLAWPDGTLPGTAQGLPTLALLGPDIRPPRSHRLSAGVVQTLAGGFSAHLSGDFRRTDFLMRRRNLNLPVAPSVRSQVGQDVYGTLAQDGAIISATGDDGRRFPEFGTVWALDPDGWSEYRGVTVGFGYTNEAVDLHGSFTRSETTDNWIGAAAGSPQGELDPLLPDHVGAWSEGRSDYDVPNTVAASALWRLPSLSGTSVSAVYRYASGRPFTPRYRRGVDANGDGSFENDIPFVPQPDELGALHDEWTCLGNQSGGFAVRNSCRGPERHDLSVRIRVGLGSLGGQTAGVFVEGLNLIESKEGIIDDALLLVDPDGSLTFSDGDTRVALPLVINPDFGRVVVPMSRGRMIRVGVRIGG